MTEEALQRIIGERLEKAGRFIQTAGTAFRNGDYDSCVSRAYYAVFHGMQALKEADTKQPHFGLESYFGLVTWCVEWNRFRTRLSEVGFLSSEHKNLYGSLDGFNRWREQADYQRGMINRRRAQDALNFAQRMLMVIKEVVS